GPEPATTVAVPIRLAEGHEPTRSGAAGQSGTREMIPTRPGGSASVIRPRYCCWSGRVIVNFSGLSNAPACEVAGVRERPGANGIGCRQPPGAVEPTVKLLLAPTGGLPEYGVN